MPFRYGPVLGAILFVVRAVSAQTLDGDEVTALLREYASAERTFQQAAREAGAQADWAKHPARQYLPRFKELAEKYAGQTAALPALAWILDQASQSTIEDPKADTLWVVERLTRVHAGQPEIADALKKVIHTAGRLEPEVVHALYDAVLEQNKDDAVLAQATFQKAIYLGRTSEKTDDKAVRQQAVKLFQEVKSKHKDTAFSKPAERWLFELQKLQVGMKAPPIAGIDLQGKPVRLSDHEKKVVLIDFWETNGFCREALPREAALMALFGEQPFTIFGINGNYRRKDCEQAMAEYSITWPNIYEGQKGGNAKEWNIEGRPTRFVLDRNGIIRYRGSDMDRAEETVRELMKKMPPAKKSKRP